MLFRSFLSATAVLAGAIYGLVYAVRQLGARVALQLAAVQGIALLAVLTLRSAILANYSNFDYQTEFINYASGAHGVRVVMAQVEEISRRTTDGLTSKLLSTAMCLGRLPGTCAITLTRCTMPSSPRASHSAMHPW